MSTTFRVVVPLALFSLAVGCADPVEEPDETYAPPTLPPEQVGDLFEVAGTYAYRFVMTQHVENAFDDTVYDVQTVKNYLVLNWEPGPNEGEVLHTAKLCLTVLSEVSGSTTTLRQGYYDNTPATTYTASLSSLEIGATLDIPQLVELRGITLGDPLNDPLPRPEEDNNDCDNFEPPSDVFDYDGDGDVGYTVFVDGALDADLWAVERFVFSAQGTVYDENYVSGFVEGYIEDSFICSTKPNIIDPDIDIYPDEEPANNFFEIVRAEEGLTCSDLIDDLDVYFPSDE